MRIFWTLVATSLLAASTLHAEDAAATYPSRPVRIIVDVPAGGGVDTVTRIVAEGLQSKLGQPMVVENRAGAGGNIGADAVFHAEPDGYTLLATQPAAITINPLLYKNMTFDPAKFEPVAIMTSIANVLLVRPHFPAKTAQELLAYIKANPGKVTYASQGVGTTSHLTAALLASKLDLKLVHVPYKGTSPALNDIIADHVDMIFMELASAIKLHQAGKARILGVATAKRLPSVPDVPTLDEVGVKGFESGTWNAIAAPPGTPKAIVDKLNAAIEATLKGEHAQTIFKKINLAAAGGSPADAARFIKEQTKLWADVIKSANIQPH